MKLLCSHRRSVEGDWHCHSVEVGPFRGAPGGRGGGRGTGGWAAEHSGAASRARSHRSRSRCESRRRRPWPGQWRTRTQSTRPGRQQRRRRWWWLRTGRWWWLRTGPVRAEAADRRRPYNKIKIHNLSDFFENKSFHLLTYSGRMTSVIRWEGKVGKENLRFAVNLPFMHMSGIDPNI